MKRTLDEIRDRDARGWRVGDNEAQCQADREHLLTVIDELLLEVASLRAHIGRCPEVCARYSLPLRRRAE